MQVTPSGERPFPTPPTPNAPDPESARFANRDTVVLPDEMVIRILMYLGTTDIAVCRSVNRQWQTVIDARHLLARSFYRDCHLTQRINSLAAQRNLAVERYHSHIRGWLTDFSDRGRETAEQLDNILEDVHFPKVLFFSIPKLLLNSNELICQNTVTIRHSDAVMDARFSPDGKHLVTVSGHKIAKLFEFEGGQWREKVTLRHSGWVMSANFSPDGKRLVTASSDGTPKIWRLEDGRWQEEEVAIQYFTLLKNASFSPDGKHLVVVPDGDFVQILCLEDNQWQEKVAINFDAREVTNAQFSPDGKYLVVAFWNGDVKIWELDDGQWGEKFFIPHRFCVRDACFSPDGKHLVTVISGLTRVFDFHYATLWELVEDQSQEKVTSQQWQEKATIEHSGIVNNVHFSLDGKHFVTASHDGTVKICGLVDGKWQIKASIWHSCPVGNANFSRNGKFIVTTAYRDGITKICRLADDKWQEIATIEHSEAVTNASFGPDDYQFVTTSSDCTAKIWVLKNKENDDNS